MKKHQISIIEEYISTAMISDDPETHIKWAILYLITSLSPEDISNAVEILYQQEKKIEIRRAWTTT